METILFHLFFVYLMDFKDEPNKKKKMYKKNGNFQFKRKICFFLDVNEAIHKWAGDMFKMLTVQTVEVS